MYATFNKIMQDLNLKNANLCNSGGKCLQFMHDVR